jgi:signal transduction histidine kinase
MKTQPGSGELVPSSASTMDSLRRIERTEQRLWTLALLLLLLVTVGVLLLDATSVTVERLLTGMTARIVDLLSNYATSVALLTVVVMVCAYFYEKLAMVRSRNRELVQALDTSGQMLAQRNQQLDTWAQLSHNLITEFNLPRLLDLIVRTAAEVTQSDCAAVMLREENTPHLRLAAIHKRGLQMELARRVAERAIESGEHMYLTPEALPEDLDRPDLAWEELVALAASPLVSSNNVVGALLAGRLRPQEPFSEGEPIMAALNSFASQASIALEKADLYAANQRHVDRLERLLEDLRSAQSQAVRSERLAGLGTLAAGVGYAVNNSLAAIVGQADLLAERAESGRKGLRKDAVALRTRALQMAETLKRLLALSRGSEVETTPSLDLSDLVRHSIDLVRQDFAASRIEIAESYEDLPSIPGDALQLRHICMNLLLSAANVMREGGQLIARTSAHGDGFIRLQIEASAAPVSADSGAHLADLGPLRVDASEIGPGLAAVEQIIHAHGGVIEVQDEPDDGIRFDVRLPLSTSDAAPSASQQQPAATAAPDG